MRDYGKLFWSILGAVVYAMQAALTNGFSSNEVVGFIIAGTGSLIVWMAQDTTIAEWVKSAAGAVMAGLLVLQTVITDGFTMDEWFAIGVAVLTALGVAVDGRRPVRVVEGTVLGNQPARYAP